MRNKIMKKSLGAKTLMFPTPVWVIGTYDKDGKPNAMTAAWAGICCSDPPLSCGFPQKSDLFLFLYYGTESFYGECSV